MAAPSGVPEGLLTNVYAPHSATERILVDDRVRGLALIGSERAGASVAAKNLKKSTLEVGAFCQPTILTEIPDGSDHESLDPIVRSFVGRINAVRQEESGNRCEPPADDLVM